eukprot:8392512-Ditylum_brightwellii.AAC.1
MGSEKYYKFLLPSTTVMSTNSRFAPNASTMMNINSNASTALVQYQGTTTTAVRSVMKCVAADRSE